MEEDCEEGKKREVEVEKWKAGRESNGGEDEGGSGHGVREWKQRTI